MFASLSLVMSVVLMLTRGISRVWERSTLGSYSSLCWSRGLARTSWDYILVNVSPTEPRSMKMWMDEKNRDRLRLSSVMDVLLPRDGR